MMKCKLFSILTSAFAVTLLGAGVALAQPDNDGKSEDRPKHERAERDGDRPQRDGQRGRDFIQALYEGIELTGEQKQEAKSLMEDHLPKREAFRVKMKEARQKVRKARRSGDKEAAEAALADLRELASNPPILGILDDLRGVLTNADDQATFDQNVESIKQRIKEHVEKIREKHRDKRDGDRDRPQRKRDREGNAPGEGADRDR